jgi:hypothetical protein
MNKPPWLHALALGLAAAGAAWSFSQWQGALRFALVAAIALLYVVLVLPHLGVRAIDRLVLLLRTLHWRHEQGHHHAFAGVPLQVSDDGRHAWVAAQGLQRALGRREPDDVLAARHAGRWRRDAQDAPALAISSMQCLFLAAPNAAGGRSQA